MHDDDKTFADLFDPEIYEILVELENGSKDESYIARKFKISKNDIQKRLHHLIQNNIVFTTLQEDKTVYILNHKKLSKLTVSEVFNNITDKLTTLNSFLN